MVRGPMIADGDAGVVDNEGDRQLDERDPGLLGELRKFLDHVEFALVLRAAACRTGHCGRADDVGVPAASLRQRPESQPPASGL